MLGRQFGNRSEQVVESKSTSNQLERAPSENSRKVSFGLHIQDCSCWWQYYPGVSNTLIVVIIVSMLSHEAIKSTACGPVSC